MPAPKRATVQPGEPTPTPGWLAAVENEAEHVRSQAALEVFRGVEPAELPTAVDE